MGVDIIAIMDHNLSAKEAIDLPELLQRAVSGIKAKNPESISPYWAEKAAAWDGTGKMTVDILERLWIQDETEVEDHVTFGHDKYSDRINATF